MRLLWALLGCMLLAQCVFGADKRFVVGAEADALVIVGVAKAPRDTSPRYFMLWRQLGADGGFRELGGDRSFEVETNSGDTVRVRGIPGEFAVLRMPPGTYALDSVFAVIRAGRVNYVAQGVIEGPERPAFDVRAGEAVFLGVWEMNVIDSEARARLWRLSDADARAVARASRAASGTLRLRETYVRPVPCAPHLANPMLSTRQVC